MRHDAAILQAILDGAFDPIITMDAEGRVVEVNRAAEEAFGYTAEEMVGRELAELIIPPHLREPHREGRRALRRHRAGADGRASRRAAGDAQGRQRVPGRDRDQPPAAPRPAALHGLPARRHRAPAQRARAAHAGRRAGRVAARGDGGGERGRPGARVRGRHRGGRPPARRRYGEHDPLRARRDGRRDRRLEHRRRGQRPGRHERRARRPHPGVEDLALRPPGARGRLLRAVRRAGRSAARPGVPVKRRRADPARRPAVGRGGGLDGRRDAVPP